MPRPQDGLLRSVAETFWVEEGCQIMIAKYARVKAGNYIQTGLWIGTVAYDVAQTDNLVAFLLLDISQDALQSFQVAVYVA